MAKRSTWFVAVCTLCHALAAGAQDGPPGVPPQQVRGEKSPTGIVLTAAQDGFSVALSGTRFQPLSNERLIWSIDDAYTIELLVGRASRLLSASATPDEILRDYFDGRVFAGEQTFDTRNGLTAILWTSGIRVNAAAVVGRRVA